MRPFLPCQETTSFFTKSLAHLSTFGKHLASDFHSNHGRQTMRNERNIGVRTHKAGNPGLFTAGRWGTMAAGSVLAAIGLSRRSAAGVVLAITGEGLVLAGAKARPYLKPF